MPEVQDRPYSISNLLSSMYPAVSHDCESKVEWWLAWPPDVFALTSTLLSQTGAYKCLVSPVESIDELPRANYIPPRNAHSVAQNPGSILYMFENDDALTHVRQGWLHYVTGGCKQSLNGQVCTPTTLRALAEHDIATLGLLEVAEHLHWLLHQLKQVDLNRFDLDKPTKEHCELIACLLWLHAAADETCQQFGVLAGDLGRDNLAYTLAHLTLELNGSLSRLPQRFGVVLPKMRTPQRGLTLRSMSHHVTFHRSEVKVAWRSFPWFNRDENRINALLVPWPFTVDAGHFTQDEIHKFGQDQNNRYFSVGHPDDPELDAEGKVSPPSTANIGQRNEELERAVGSLLNSASKEVERVHLLAFPELALNPPELVQVLELLKNRAKPGEDPPVVVSGLRSKRRNQMAVAAYFVDRWYIYLQSKHHRWVMDPRQVSAYGLESRLKNASLWWEGIEIPNRKLTFFMPNPWLTLCPLICEDLAQVEPVSELIRGIGPTLLLALLMDGPQLAERWSARYAAVFANDPGTSVLTVNSLGMTTRWRRPSQNTNRTVALWDEWGAPATPIPLETDERAILLTIEGRLNEEIALDNRSDGGTAVYLGERGVRRFELGVEPCKEHKDTDQPCETEDWQIFWNSSLAEERSDLTLLSQCADTCLEAPDYVIEAIEKLVNQPQGPVGWSLVADSVRTFLQQRLETEDPKFLPLEPRWQERFQKIINLIREFRQEHPLEWDRDDLQSRMDDWGKLCVYIGAKNSLNNDSERFPIKMILWSLHNRVLRAATIKPAMKLSGAHLAQLKALDMAVLAQLGPHSPL